MKATRSTVVKVGQVWTSENGNVSDLITRISSSRAFHELDGIEYAFADLNPDHTTVDDWEKYGWMYEESAVTEAPTVSVPISKVAAVKLGDEELAFFKAVAPGNCPCNMPRASCEYHR